MHSTLNPTRTNHDWSRKNLALIFLLTLLAFLIMGYHPGLEDDAFYLAAIKHDLNPALFPHDFQFFTIQFQATIFDKLIALTVRLTHLPLAWVALLWQLAAIFFILHGCFRIARRCFPDAAAQWAAVAMVAVLLTIPVSGSGVNLADQHLHPRNLATAAILAAIVAVLDSTKNSRKLWLAAFLLAIAFSIHAIMASFGISFCAFLWWNLRQPTPRSRAALLNRTIASSVLPLFPLWWKSFSRASRSLALFIPLGWLFAPTTDAWRQAASTRTFYHLGDWAWYEWLGVFAPLVLIYAYRAWLAQRFQRCDNAARNVGASAPEGTQLLPFLSTLLYYGIFQTIVALAIMLPPSLERLRPFEPMRYLHLLYLFFFLVAGALLGRYVLSSKQGRHPERSRSSGEARDLARSEPTAGATLHSHAYRWALLFIPLAAGMFYAQHQMYPATAHIEWPGAESTNPWLAAFAWIREFTPTDAYFALDPHYMQLPGEDYHGFRALAERSSLADLDKDAGMAARVPGLAPRWLKEVTAEKGWRNFRAADFDRLKKDFGVTWFVFSRADAQFSDKQPSHFWCWYQDEDETVKVCHLGETTKRPPFRGLDENNIRGQDPSR